LSIVFVSEDIWEIKEKKNWLQKSSDKYKKGSNKYWKKRYFQERKKFSKKNPQTGKRGCDLCNKPGHFVKDCPQKQPKVRSMYAEE
jgi:hypothetical protein